MSIEIAHDEKRVRLVRVEGGKVSKLGLKGRVDSVVSITRGGRAVKIYYMKGFIIS
jgi:hypothetical protein